MTPDNYHMNSAGSEGPVDEIEARNLISNDGEPYVQYGRLSLKCLTMKEQLRNTQFPDTYQEVADIISKLVEPIEDDSKAGHRWDGTVKGVCLLSGIAGVVRLGDRVNCRIIGDYESGAAVIVSPGKLYAGRNVGKRYGFLIQHADPQDDPVAFKVSHAPARDPKPDKIYRWFDLFDLFQRAEPNITPSDLADQLMLALADAARKKQP